MRCFSKSKRFRKDCIILRSLQSYRNRTISLNVPELSITTDSSAHEQISRYSSIMLIKSRNLKKKSNDCWVLEDSRALLLANHMDSNMRYFVDKRYYENTIKDMPDVKLFYSFLDQAKSSHRVWIKGILTLWLYLNR